MVQPLHELPHGSAATRDAVLIDDVHAKALASKLEASHGVHFQQLNEEARQGDLRQQVDLGVVKAFRLHWKAALWSMGISTCLVMEGYDLVIINSFYGQEAFINRFGSVVPGSATGKKEITAPWQSGLSNSALCGEIIGLAINGWAADRFGYRRTLMATLVVMALTIFTPVFAPSLPLLSLGEVLQGVPWGMFQTLTTAFAVEICPQTLRGYLTTYVTACWGTGIFLSSVVVRATLGMKGDWSWRMPFVLQWVWPLPLFLVALFVPESPWWLIRKGRSQDARESVRRLAPDGFYDERGLDQQVALMTHTTALEELETRGATYLDCFKGINLRRTMIVCVVWGFQILDGGPLLGYGVVFYQRAGMSETMSLNFNMIMNTTYILGVFVAWKAMDHYGRRTIYLFGGVTAMMGLIVIGGLGFATGTKASWAIGSILIVFAMFENCTIGPLCYAIVSEVPSGRLRAKTIVLGRLTYNICGLLANTVTPRMLSATAWNWGAKGAFFWLGTCSLMTLLLWWILPETRNRSFGELELLFENKVSARAFSRTKVDQFDVRAALGTGLSATPGSLADEKRSTKSAGSVRNAVADSNE